MGLGTVNGSEHNYYLMKQSLDLIRKELVPPVIYTLLFHRWAYLDKPVVLACSVFK